MLGKSQCNIDNTFQTIIRQTEERIAVLEKELEQNRLLTSKILLQIKGIFLEALAKLVPTKLVLREVQVKTSSHAGTGGVFEHPAKDKIDYRNPI